MAIDNASRHGILRFSMGDDCFNWQQIDLDAAVGFGGDVFGPFLLQQEVGVACRIR